MYISCLMWEGDEDVVAGYVSLYREHWIIDSTPTRPPAPRWWWCDVLFSLSNTCRAPPQRGGVPQHRCSQKGIGHDTYTTPVTTMVVMYDVMFTFENRQESSTARGGTHEYRRSHHDREHDTYTTPITTMVVMYDFMFPF